MRFFNKFILFSTFFVIVGEFRYLKVAEIAFEVTVVLGLLILIARTFTPNSGRRDDTIWITIILLLSNAFISSLNARFQTDQPIVYGLLAQRNLLMVGVGAYLAVNVAHGRISRTSLRQTVYIIGAINVLLLLLREVPSSLNIFQTMGARTLDVGDGQLYPIIPSSIAFVASLIVLSNSIKRRTLPGFIGALVGVTLITALQGGVINIIASIISVIFVISLSIRGVSRVPRFVMRFYAVAFAAYVALSFSIATDKIPEALNMTLALITGGTNESNFSLFARLDQLSIVREHGVSVLLSGYGQLSNQWMDGLAGRFGYFHPSDIGLVGVLFVYGLFGAFLFLHIGSTAGKEIRSVRMDASSERIAFSGALLHLLISSTVTGHLIFHAEMAVTLIALTRALRDGERRFAEPTVTGSLMIAQ